MRTLLPNCRRILIGVCVFAPLAWTGGLAAYWVDMTMLSNAAMAAAADCASVFTGRLERVQTALSILDRERPRRVLISGHGEGLNSPQLAALQEAYPGLFDCCVDVGTQALNTHGNAIETRDWATTHGCSAVAIYTDDAHMRRAFMETRNVLAHVPITPHSIAYARDAGPLSALRRSLPEYHKLVGLALVRLTGARGPP